MKDKTGKEIDEDTQAQWGTDDIEPDFPKGRTATSFHNNIFFILTVK